MVLDVILDLTGCVCGYGTGQQNKGIISHLHRIPAALLIDLQIENHAIAQFYTGRYNRFDRPNLPRVNLLLRLHFNLISRVNLIVGRMQGRFVPPCDK